MICFLEISSALSGDISAWKSLRPSGWPVTGMVVPPGDTNLAGRPASTGVVTGELVAA